MNAEKKGRSGVPIFSAVPKDFQAYLAYQVR